MERNHRRASAPWERAILALACLSMPPFLGTCGAAEDGLGQGHSQPPPALSGQDAAAPRGHWYRVTGDRAEGQGTGHGLTAQQRERAAALESMGYAAGMESAEGASEGIEVLAEALAQPGLNFYSSGHGPDAILMDMSGTVLHRWHKPILDIWPDKDIPFAYFRKARLFDGGLVLVIFEGFGLVALDAQSNVLWTYDRPAHHDVHQAPDGSFFALDRDARVVTELHPDRPLANDGIVFLAPDGTVRGRVSLLDGLLRPGAATGARALIEQRIAEGARLEETAIAGNREKLRANPELLKKIDYIGDCLHTNSVRRIGPRFAAANDGLEEGWFLVSIRELSLLATFEVS